MNTMTERSMMWRTTYAFGAFGLALVLAYVGFLLAGAPAHSVALRLIGAGALSAGACACVVTALREMRAGKRSPM
jgi:hypothetical protein